MTGAAAKIGVVAKHVAKRGAAAKKEERRGEGRSGDVEWGGGDRRGDSARRRGAGHGGWGGVRGGVQPGCLAHRSFLGLARVSFFCLTPNA